MNYDRFLIRAEKAHESTPDVAPDFQWGLRAFIDGVVDEEIDDAFLIDILNVRDADRYYDDKSPALGLVVAVPQVNGPTLTAWVDVVDDTLPTYVLVGDTEYSIPEHFQNELRRYNRPHKGTP